MSSLAAFSTDVEDYFQSEVMRHLFPRETWERQAARVEANTERVLEVAEEAGARGTFFILGWIAERYPDLVRRIAAAGHEVASHGVDHELITRQTPEEFRRDVTRSRELLQDLSGQEVIGYRAPSYTVTRRTLWALDILAEAGYRYDSSIFPIRRRRYGIPDAPRWPHRLDLPSGRPLVEFPMPTVRLLGVNLPATGGAYLRLMPFWFQRRAVTAMIDDEAPFVVNVHPWELDPGQPRQPVSARTRWTHYHNLERTRERLRGLLGLATYRSQQEVLVDLGLLNGSVSSKTD